MNVLELTFLKDRLDAGVDVHPSEDELIQFYELAKKIAPQLDFTYKGCQECVNSMVRFVFENQNILNEQPAKSKK